MKPPKLSRPLSKPTKSLMAGQKNSRRHSCVNESVVYLNPIGGASLKRRFTRRSVLAALGATAALPVLAACQPQVVEVERVQVVEKEVPIERVVTQIVEKEVERVVTVKVDNPVIVEKEVVVEREVEKEVVVEMEALPPLIIGQLNAFTGSLSYFGVFPSQRRGAGSRPRQPRRRHRWRLGNHCKP